MDANNEETVFRLQISRRHVDGRNTYDAVWNGANVSDYVVHSLLDYVRKCSGGPVAGMERFASVSTYGECSIYLTEVEEIPF